MWDAGNCHDRPPRSSPLQLFPDRPASNLLPGPLAPERGITRSVGCPSEAASRCDTNPEEHEDMASEWGPLEALIGEWESDRGGLDAAFSHSKGEVLQTPYEEKLTMKPFGPVDNG